MSKRTIQIEIDCEDEACGKRKHGIAEGDGVYCDIFPYRVGVGAGAPMRCPDCKQSETTARHDAMDASFAVRKVEECCKLIEYRLRGPLAERELEHLGGAINVIRLAMSRLHHIAERWEPVIPSY